MYLDKSNYFSNAFRIREKFLQQEDLPSKFLFFKYLKRCSKSAFGDLVELHWVTMATFIVLQLIIWLQIANIGYSLLVIGILTCGGTLALLLKSRSILIQVTKAEVIKKKEREQREEEEDDKEEHEIIEEAAEKKFEKDLEKQPVS